MRLAYTIFLTLIIVLVGVLAGCSGNPTAPDITGQNPADADLAGVNEADAGVSDGHVVWGQWGIAIEPESGVAAAVPARELDFHINVTQWLQPPNCTDCIQIILTAWDPVERIVDVTLVLKNPTALAGYDVKAIISIYDTKEFLDPDAYTDIHHSPGTRNPYYIFAEDGEDNLFDAGESHARGIRVHFPIGATPNATVTVDASWPDPQDEPWKIDNVLVLGPLQNDNTHHIAFTCHIYDHQNDTQVVVADLGGIATGAQAMGDDSAHGDYLPHDAIWGLDGITTIAANGTYECWIQAGQVMGEHQTYQKFEIEVILPIFNQPPLYIVSVMQSAEIADYLDEAKFAGYSDMLRTLSNIFNVRGGKIELQPDWTFIQGEKNFDPTLFTDLQALGHGVSAHSFDEADQNIGQVHNLLDSAGVVDTVIAAGGFGGTLGDTGNWAAYLANFEIAGSQQMFLAASSYRDPVTMAIDGLRTPMRPTLDGSDWMVHDPDGPLVYIGGAATWLISAGDINFFNNIPIVVDYALAGVLPDRINVYYWYDPVEFYSGSPSSDARLTFWAQTLDGYFADKVEDGDVIWANFVDIYEAYLDWES